MASSSNIKDCGICGEEYDERERCPRALPCAHCICTVCTQQLINKNDKKCPFCRESFAATSAQHLKRNFVALGFLKYIKELELKKESSNGTPSKSRSEMVEDMKKSSYEMYKKDLESLNEAEDRLKNIIKDNNVLKQHNAENHKKLKQEIMDRLNTLNTNCELTQQFLDGENEKTEQMLQDIKKHQAKLEQVKSELNAATKFAQVDDAIDKVEGVHEAAGSCLQTYRTGLSGVHDFQARIKNNSSAVGDKLDVLNDVLASLNEDDDINQIMQNRPIHMPAKSSMTKKQYQKQIPLRKQKYDSRFSNYKLPMNFIEVASPTYAGNMQIHKGERRKALDCVKYRSQSDFGTESDEEE